MKNNASPLNPWAFVAIVCSVGVCPFFTIAGVLLGIRAIVDIKARPGTRGIRLAWAAILVGSLVTGLWGGSMLWWNTNVRSQMKQGPIQAIIDGQQEAMLFLKHFTYQDEEEATTFLDELTSRYGSLESGYQIGSHQIEGAELAFFMMPLEANLNYECTFSNAPSVQAEAKFILFKKNDNSRQFTNRFAWLCFYDEKLGDLVYPADIVISKEEHVKE
jgi:hypothetical protein